MAMWKSVSLLCTAKKNCSFSTFIHDIMLKLKMHHMRKHLFFSDFSFELTGRKKHCINFYTVRSYTFVSILKLLCLNKDF